MTSYSDIDPPRLRQAMGRFCTGLAVITGATDTGPAGLLVQSFVSVSLDPPLVSFCPQKSSESWPRIADTGRFGANVLSAQQRHLVTAFSRSGGDKFRNVWWYPSPYGQPILEQYLAYVDCEIVDIHDAGDHHIVVGRIEDVRESDLNEDPPLLYYRGRLGTLSESSHGP